MNYYLLWNVKCSNSKTDVAVSSDNDIGYVRSNIKKVQQKLDERYPNHEITIDDDSVLEKGLSESDYNRHFFNVKI